MNISVEHDTANPIEVVHEQYDPTNWLVSATRVLGAFVTRTLNDPDVTVEMSFPDTHSWTKEMPLDKVIVHFEQDDIADPVLGFGIPGVLVDNGDGTVQVDEAAQHVINYDVGVWASAECGGGTKRMEVVQAIKDIFIPARARMALNEATGGLSIVSFDGGRNELDRINDVPVWRALNMTLLVKVFSRHVQAEPDVVPLDFKQNEQLTISVPNDPNEPLTS